MNEGRRYVPSFASLFRIFLQSHPKRKSGVDISLDASELEGISEDELRRKYDVNSRGSAGVPGGRGEDFSDMVAKEMAKKKQKMDRERENKKTGKEFKF